MVDVDQVVTSAGVDQTTIQPAPTVARPMADWQAANRRKIDAVQQLGRWPTPPTTWEC
jgi:hypothetical protein